MLRDSYLETDLRNIEQGLRQFRQDVDGIQAAIHVALKTRDTLVNNLDNFRRSLERADTYRTSLYLPDELTDVLRRAVEEKIVPLLPGED